MKQDNLPIATGAMVVDTKKGKYILVINERISIPDNEVSLLSTIQIQEHGIEVDDKAKRHDGSQSIIADGLKIEFKLKNGLLVKSFKYPMEEELNTLQHVVLTSDLPWDPTQYNDDEAYEMKIIYLTSIIWNKD